METNHKNSGGNHMSLKKSTTRRVALFTSSSLIAASLSAFALLGVAALPSAAAAQSVCTPTPTSGAGTNTVTYSSGSQTSGIVCTATGDFTLNKTSGTASSTTAYALDITSTGTTTVNVTGANIGGAAQNMPNGSGAVDFSGVAGGVTFNLAGTTNTSGRWYGSGNSVFSAGNDTINYQGVGFNFLGGRGPLAAASIDLGAGNDTINLAAFLNIGGHTQDAGLIDFGDGDDTFNISGVFTSHGGELANLETLNLSGTIFMGTAATTLNQPQVIWTSTDGGVDRADAAVVANDILRIHGATFTGSGNARIVMDVNIGAGEQAGCEVVTGVADCLDLRGGSTAGVTTLAINNLGPEALYAGYDLVGITLVDVGGGTSAAGHFVLDPNTPNLTTDPLYGQVISRPGLFSIVFLYDEKTQRHELVSLPHGEVIEYAMLSGAAQSIWHLTADTVSDRQADLRGRSEATGLWLRTSGEYTKRDTSSSFEGVGRTYTIDNDYKLYAGTVIGGMDLVSGTSGDYDYVLGAEIGYVTSSFELDKGQASGRFTGATGGVYGSVWSPRAFLDATFNMNGLTLDHESPALGAKTNTYTTGFGARLEGGMRWSLGSSMFAEPLVSLAFARTSFEEISLAGGEVQPDDAQSRRAALGLRVGADYPGQSVNWSYFVTGRAWHEFDGDSRVVVKNPGADLVYADDFSGTFSEFEAGLNLSNDSGTLSGFVTSGVKAKGGYSAVDLSAGVSLRW